MKSNIRLTVQASLAALVILTLTTDAVAAPKYLSPSAIVSDGTGKTLYITCATANQVLCFDTQSRKAAATIAVPDSPNGLITSTDGQTLYVTCGGTEGTVCVIDIKTSKIAHQIAVGHTPMLGSSFLQAGKNSELYFSSGLNTPYGMETLNIIGCGRVGQCFGKIWSQRMLLEIDGLLSRTFKSAEQASVFLGQGCPTKRFEDLHPADYYMELRKQRHRFGSWQEQLNVPAET